MSEDILFVNRRPMAPSRPIYRLVAIVSSRPRLTWACASLPCILPGSSKTFIPNRCFRSTPFLRVLLFVYYCTDDSVFKTYITKLHCRISYVDTLAKAHMVYPQTMMSVLSTLDGRGSRLSVLEHRTIYICTHTIVKYLNWWCKTYWTSLNLSGWVLTSCIG